MKFLLFDMKFRLLHANLNIIRHGIRNFLESVCNKYIVVNKSKKVNSLLLILHLEYYLKNLVFQLTFMFHL